METEVAGGREEAGAEVAVGVEVVVDGEILEELFIGAEVLGMKVVVGGRVCGEGELGVEGGVQVEERHDGCGLEEMELDVVLGLDEHRGPFTNRELVGHVTGRGADVEETRGC